MAAVEVTCTNCGKGWLDYAVAAVAAASFLAAAVALYLSRTSANAAKEALNIQRTEHAAFLVEIGKAPDLEISLHHRLLEEAADGRPASVLVNIEVRNKGRKAAEDAIFNLATPEVVRISKSDQDGNLISVANALLTAEAPYGQGEAIKWHSWNQTLTFLPLVTMYLSFRLAIDRPGTYPVAAMIRHHEIPGDGLMEGAEIRLRPAE